MLLAGFDPGGKGRFGWCIVEAKSKLPLAIRHAGVEDHAAAAVDKALTVIPNSSSVVAAGIDSPLFWSLAGDRIVDAAIRYHLQQLGSRSAAGIVQNVNSLRGACVIQGVLAALRLRATLPRVRITESHPKALLWLLGVASPAKPTAKVSMRNLQAFVQAETQSLSEHERDAALGTLGAWAMMTKPAGWKDLVPYERDPVMPISSVEYWMPEIAAEQRLAANAPQAA